LADDDNIGNIYPQLSYQRVLYADDVYASGYCVDTGLEAERPAGDISNGYKVYQSCSHGRIDNWPTGSDTTSLYLGNTKYVSWVDLGTVTDISARYGLKNVDYPSVFESIHWESSVPAPGLVLMLNASDPKSFQVFTTNDTANLTSMSGSAYVNPIAAHVYLVRMCTTLTCSLAQTEIYYKLLALNNASPYAVRWNVFYTNFEVDRDEDEGILSTEDRSKVALGFGVTSFVLLVLFGLYSLIQKRKAVTTLGVPEGPNVSTMATAYQAI